MDQWMINSLIFSGVLVFCAFCGCVIGYWMGRNSAERPFLSEAQPRHTDQGPTDESQVDVFRDAMQGADDKRIPTIK